MTVFDDLWAAPMSDRGRITFDERQGTVNLEGMQTGKVTALSARPNDVLGGTVVILHEEGSSYFVGRGIQGYAPAQTRAILVELRPSSNGGGQATFRYVSLSNYAEVKGNAAHRQTLTEGVISRIGANS